MNCRKVTNENKPCKRKAKEGSEFCAQHSLPKKEKPKKVAFNYEINFEDLKKELLIINETTNMIILMNSVMKVVHYIESLNPEYKFDENEKVCNKLYRSFIPMIYHVKRIELILDFLLDHSERKLNQPFSTYTVNPLTEDEKKLFYTFIPRGCFIGTLPVRPDTKTDIPKKDIPKTEPKKDIPKTEPKKDIPKKDIPKTEPNNSSKEKLLKVMEDLKKYLIGKDVKVYLKLIMTSTSDLKYTRKEIMELYKEFHPDKAGTDIKAQKLCTLASTKISLLKKKLDSSSSPIRPIGNLYNDMCKILYS